MKKTRSFLLTAGIALAMAFTFSCSGDDGEPGGGSSSSGGGNSSSSDDNSPPKVLAACYSTSPMFPGNEQFCVEYFNEAEFEEAGGTAEKFCQFLGQMQGITVFLQEGSCPRDHTLSCSDADAAFYLYGVPAGFKCEDIPK